jgi:hypothetical protein
VYRAETLRAAWHKVRENGGAAGVDGQSVKKFAARAALSANMNETVTRKKISVEGESGNECGEWK